MNKVTGLYINDNSIFPGTSCSEFNKWDFGFSKYITNEQGLVFYEE